MADDRIQIIFECTQCRNRNYVSTKNKKKTTSKLTLRKFCPHCRSHQPHKETK